MDLMIVLACLNSICAGINFVSKHYWIIPINILAIIFCFLSIYAKNK